VLDFKVELKSNMTKPIQEISLFLPAFNEEQNIKKTVVDAVKVLNKVAEKWEIIIINDGSKDRTLEISRDLEGKDKRIRVINHEVNKGYGEALKTGLYASKYKWITTIDSDGQFDFSEILKLYNKSESADVIWGYRLNRRDSLMRKINGFAWTMLSNFLFGFNVHDVDCGFKLIKKDVLDKIGKLQSTRGGMISPEILARVKKADFKIAQVSVHHYPRKVGKQTGADLKVIIQSFVDLFKLRLNL
jgi:glycosyltransferase involved in cell wall biosynthesis